MAVLLRLGAPDGALLREAREHVREAAAHAQPAQREGEVRRHGDEAGEEQHPIPKLIAHIRAQVLVADEAARLLYEPDARRFLPLAAPYPLREGLACLIVAWHIAPGGQGLRSRDLPEALRPRFPGGLRVRQRRAVKGGLRLVKAAAQQLISAIFRVLLPIAVAAGEAPVRRQRQQRRALLAEGLGEVIGRGLKLLLRQREALRQFTRERLVSGLRGRSLRRRDEVAGRGRFNALNRRRLRAAGGEKQQSENQRNQLFHAPSSLYVTSSYSLVDQKTECKIPSSPKLRRRKLSPYRKLKSGLP